MIRYLKSKGKHIVRGVERYMKLLCYPRGETDRSVGVLLDGKPDIKRGDFIVAVKPVEDGPIDKEHWNKPSHHYVDKSPGGW